MKPSLKVLLILSRLCLANFGRFLQFLGIFSPQDIGFLFLNYLSTKFSTFKNKNPMSWGGNMPKNGKKRQILANIDLTKSTAPSMKASYRSIATVCFVDSGAQQTELS